jgi:uncharacterized membrane protein YciS (DUF1049 family)
LWFHTRLSFPSTNTPIISIAIPSYNNVMDIFLGWVWRKLKTTIYLMWALILFPLGILCFIFINAIFWWLLTLSMMMITRALGVCHSKLMRHKPRNQKTSSAQATPLHLHVSCLSNTCANILCIVPILIYVLLKGHQRHLFRKKKIQTNQYS